METKELKENVKSGPAGQTAGLKEIPDLWCTLKYTQRLTTIKY